MKRQPRILAGTALGLLMASSPLAALPLQNDTALRSVTALPLILAQAEGGGEATDGGPAPAEQAAPEPQPAPEPVAVPEPVALPEPVAQAAPAPQIEAQTEAPAPAEEPAEQKPHKKKPVEEQAEPAPQKQPQAEAPAAEPEQKPRAKKEKPAEEQQEPVKKPAAEEKPAPEVKPAPAEKPAEQPKAKPAPAEEPAAKPAEKPAQGEQKPAAEKPKPAPEGEKPAAEKPAAEKPAKQPEASPAPAEKPAEGAKPKPETSEEPAKEGHKPVPAEGEKKPGEQPEAKPQPGEKPAEGEQKPAAEQPKPAAEQPKPAEKPVEGQAPANPNAAPIFDSQKQPERPAEGQKGEPAKPQPGQATTQQPAQQPVQPAQQPAQKPAEKPAPPPVDDKAAQATIQPEKIAPVTQEKGTRLERAPDFDVRKMQRPEGADIVKNFGDRTIIQFNNQIIVESNDRPRLTRDAQDVYYEDLPGGRTRETVVRDNGNQIITVRNRYGDIVRRSRITPDGREYVLSYVDERYYEEMHDWRDPGDDLPPIYVDIPRDEYILESERVRSPDDYYVFLERPPVEKVRRLYSIDEVKRSARVRDIARRIDLDTLNFDFGSSTIAESEVEKLQGVADAMQKLLAKNPAETFLIEGHTDAVGSDLANLALSDRRAEAVANALTNVFDIPPENLTTQGYGERYLKINTQKPERENRRVAIRRITPLVAPVANAK